MRPPTLPSFLIPPLLHDHPPLARSSIAQMSAPRSVNAFFLRGAVIQTVRSLIVPFDSLPIIRYADGSGFGLRSYPFDMPGYGFGLVESYPRTAAEQLLDNYEIVEAIFDGMHRYEDARKIRRTMLRLMLATKAFHHHAAAILWSRLGPLGIQPLLDIVADIRTPEVGYENGYVQLADSPTISILSISRPTTSEIAVQLERPLCAFLYYASLVREVQVSAIGLDSRRLAYLTSLIKDRLSLLPSLTHLSWDATAPPSNDLLYVLSPTLQHLRVVVCAFEAEPQTEKAFRRWYRRLRHKLSVLSPHISDITIRASTMYSNRTVTFPNYFKNLHTLAVFRMTAAGG